MSFKLLEIGRDVLRRVRIGRFAPCAIAICAAAADAPHVIEVKLDARDAGVVWRSADGGRAVICDGIALKPERFRPVPEGTPRADPAVRAHVRVADLASCRTSA